MVDLEAGNVSLEDCGMLAIDFRVDRLLSLYEIHQEVFSPVSTVNTKQMKTLVAIRTTEMDEYRKAAEDLKIFNSNFDQVKISNNYS
jgi:hypothetical protein